jgi:hypothetical protein
MSSEAYQREVKRLARRDWETIRNLWLDEVGKLNQGQPGVAPEFPAEDVVGMRELVEAVHKNVGEQRVELSRFNAPLLHQGLFLLHKAGNVLTAAHDQACTGLPTWSLSTAYQAGLFALDAVLHLMGVAFVNYDPRRQFLVDVWPGPSSGLSKRALASYKDGQEINVIPLSSSVQHFHRWAVLQRLLNTTRGLPIPSDIKEAFLSLQDRAFADQRNDLHYSHTWTFDDIHKYTDCPELVDFDTLAKLLAGLGPKSAQFSLVLGTATFFLASQMLKSLASEAPFFEAEYSLLVESCSSPRLKLRPTFESASGLAMQI